MLLRLGRVAMRDNLVRIDADAFDRGVDEILQLKPIVRAVKRIFHLGDARHDVISAEKPLGRPATKSK